MAAGVLCTVAFGAVQLRYFLAAWKSVLGSHEGGQQSSARVTPFQAFINTLSSNLGNGSIAGMATAVYSGGPGAAFWVVVFGLVLMSVRFAEVYLSIYYGARTQGQSILGGPMLYLQQVPGGKLLPYVYALFCLFFGLSLGNAMQSNSIAVVVSSSWGVTPYAIAAIIALFVAYVVFGGASRVSAVTARLVPLNVAVFCVSTTLVLGYHYAAIIPALTLIIKSAFTPLALAGGVLGFSIKQAIRYGMERSIMATESGLGTAAILYGYTGSQEPMKNSIVAMLSTFISTCVCLVVALCVVVSNTWQSGLNSTALTAAAFSTALGSYGCVAVTFLSITFGTGVMVAYAYITRSVWLYLTNGKLACVFPVLYCACAALGALAPVEHVWNAAGVANAGMLFINLFGIVWLIPVVKAGIKEYQLRR